MPLKADNDLEAGSPISDPRSLNRGSGGGRAQRPVTGLWVWHGTPPSPTVPLTPSQVGVLIPGPGLGSSSGPARWARWHLGSSCERRGIYAQRKMKNGPAGGSQPHARWRVRQAGQSLPVRSHTRW